MLVINPGPTGASLVFVLCALMTCALIIQSIQFQPGTSLQRLSLSHKTCAS